MVSKVCPVRNDIDRTSGQMYITANRVHILRDPKLNELHCGYGLNRNYDRVLYSSTESCNAVNESNFGVPSGPESNQQRT